MTRWTCRAFGLLVLSAGLALAQPATKKDPAPKEPPRPAPGSLEETLDKALQNSADIKVAEAKVHDAEAELNRVRQQVLMKATTHHNDLRLAKRMLDIVETNFARVEAAHKAGGAPAESLDAARLALEKQKAEIEKLDAELKALRGEFAIHRGVKSVAFSPDGRYLSVLSDGGARLWDASTGRALSPAGKAVWDLAGPDKPAVQAPMAERLRKWLDQEIEAKLSVENMLRLEDAFDVLTKKYGTTLPIRMMNKTEDHQYVDNLRGMVQIGALLQAIEDGGDDVTFVIREYGLLVTTKDRVPDGAVRALDFWKAKAEKKPDIEKK